MDTCFGGPNTKGYSISGSILGSPYFGKLPNPDHLVLGPLLYPDNSPRCPSFLELMVIVVRSWEVYVGIPSTLELAVRRGP